MVQVNDLVEPRPEEIVLPAVPPLLPIRPNASKIRQFQILHRRLFISGFLLRSRHLAIVHRCLETAPYPVRGPMLAIVCEPCARRDASYRQFLVMA